MKHYRIIEVVAVIIIAVAILFFYIRNVSYRTQYLDIIEKHCKGTSIDPYLILSMIKIESSFNPNATSKKGAIGLMQVQEATLKDLPSSGLKNKSLRDPEYNIEVGIAYFKKLISRYNGNYHIALLAYNAGLGNVDKWLEQGIIDKNLEDSVVEEIPFGETRKYLEKVMSSYRMYKTLYK